MAYNRFMVNPILVKLWFLRAPVETGTQSCNKDFILMDLDVRFLSKTDNPDTSLNFAAIEENSSTLA